MYTESEISDILTNINTWEELDKFKDVISMYRHSFTLLDLRYIKAFTIMKEADFDVY